MQNIGPLAINPMVHHFMATTTSTPQEDAAAVQSKTEGRLLLRRLVLLAVPYQGHLNPMIQLANLLDSKGFTIIFILTQSTPLDLSKYPNIQFRQIRDGMPETKAGGGGAAAKDVTNILTQLNIYLIDPLRECLVDLLTEKESIACLISDVNWYFTQQVADDLKLPRIVFRTAGVSAFLALDYLPVFQQKGYLSGQVEHFSEMESSTKIFDPRKMDPKKIQELAGIRQKKNLPASSAPVGKKTPARVSTPASTSSLLRDQPDDAVVEKQPGEDDESRKRMKVTDTRHGKGKEGRFIAPPKPSTIEIPSTTSVDLEHMAPEELNAYLSKLVRAVRITGEVATNRIRSPSSDLAEKEELLKKQKSQIDSLDAKVRKLDGRRLSLEADLGASQLNLEKAEKVVADREAELVKVKAKLEEVQAELARCVKVRDDLQLEVDSFASRMETLKKEFMGSEELRTDIMLLMTQAMKGGFTNALRDVKKVLPDFDISSIERANLYDDYCFARYGRYIDDFRAGISLHDKYVKPVLEQQRIVEDDVDEDIEMDDPDTASSRPPNA